MGKKKKKRENAKSVESISTISYSPSPCPARATPATELREKIAKHSNQRYVIPVIDILTARHMQFRRISLSRHIATLFAPRRVSARRRWIAGAKFFAVASHPRSIGPVLFPLPATRDRRQISPVIARALS